MSTLRIAYVINSMEGGGAASPIPAIAGVLRNLGAEVRVFALTRRNGKALPPIAKANVDVLVRDGGGHDHLAAMRWLKTQIRAWQATHVWTSLSRATLLGLWMAPTLNLPLICWQHNAFLKPWNRRLMRAMQSRAFLWIGDSRCVSELTAQRLAVGQDRLMTWPIFAANAAAPQSRAWQPGQVIRIGSLGRLHVAKGYDVLIDALSRLRAAGFVPPAPLSIEIAGEGGERKRLEAQARRAGIGDLHLRGYAENPAEFLAQLHLYVQPSRREGFCIAAHEAQAAGLPILASAVGELPFSVRNGVTGQTVPPEDPAALAEQLARMLADPVTLHRQGQAAREAVLAQYSFQQFARTGAAIFDRLRMAGPAT